MPVWEMPQRKTDFIPDILLQLRPEGAAALSATEVAGGTPRDIDVNANLTYHVAIVAQAYTGYVAGTAQWEILVEAAPTAGGTYVEIGRALLRGGATKARIALHSSNSMALDPSLRFVRTRAVKTGTPGNLTYFSYATHNL